MIGYILKPILDMCPQSKQQSQAQSTLEVGQVNIQGFEYIPCLLKTNTKYRKTLVGKLVLCFYKDETMLSSLKKKFSTNIEKLKSYGYIVT